MWGHWTWVLSRAASATHFCSSWCPLNIFTIGYFFTLLNTKFNLCFIKFIKAIGFYLIYIYISIISAIYSYAYNRKTIWYVFTHKILNIKNVKYKKKAFVNAPRPAFIDCIFHCILFCSICNYYIICLLIIHMETKDFKVPVFKSLEFNGHLLEKQLLPSTYISILKKILMNSLNTHFGNNNLETLHGLKASLVKLEKSNRIVLNSQVNRREIYFLVLLYQ